MTGQELICMVKEYNLEDMEIVFNLLEPDGSKYGIGLRSFHLCKIPEDISYSEKICILNGDERC